MQLKFTDAALERYLRDRFNVNLLACIFKDVVFVSSTRDSTSDANAGPSSWLAGKVGVANGSVNEAVVTEKHDWDAKKLLTAAKAKRSGL